MYEFIYVLCEVAIVSQLFIPFLFITWNAVMPLSRASTRGRYSRIVGVTSSTSTSKLYAWLFASSGSATIIVLLV